MEVLLRVAHSSGALEADCIFSKQLDLLLPHSYFRRALVTLVAKWLNQCSATRTAKMNDAPTPTKYKKATRARRVGIQLKIQIALAAGQ